MQRINERRAKIGCALDAEKNYAVHWMQRKTMMCIGCRGKL
jgi:hypothetical protein